MKILSSIILLAFAMPLLSQESSPANAKIITSDIDLFWACFDQAGTKLRAENFEPYLKEGTVGLKDFIPNRIESAQKLAKKVKRKKAYYQLIRKSSLNIKEAHTQSILKIFENMEAIYPAATFPNTYFVIGALNSGGTASENGLIMGAEMFGPQAENAKEKAILNFDYIPGIVAHELIHFQQNLPNSYRLLDQSIREGSADLIALIIQKLPLKHHLDDWAVPQEEALWKEFKAIMHGKKYQGWLYGGKRPKGRPADLGYWMGYRICKAYYDKQDDKKKAIETILNIQDFEAFLEASAYSTQFE